LEVTWPFTEGDSVREGESLPIEGDELISVPELPAVVLGDPAPFPFCPVTLLLEPPLPPKEG
jgi:hypothetical protein